MTDQSPQRIGQLTDDARASLADLLKLQALKADCWFMRLFADPNHTGWVPLTNDSAENDRRIKDRFTTSGSPVTDLVLAYVGEVDWRGKIQLMVRMQYFRAGYKSGLLFGSHLRKDIFDGSFHPHGGFLIFGGCQNPWI